jgi:hypothetical protein
VIWDLEFWRLEFPRDFPSQRQSFKDSNAAAEDCDPEGGRIPDRTPNRYLAPRGKQCETVRKPPRAATGQDDAAAKTARGWPDGLGPARIPPGRFVIYQMTNPSDVAFRLSFNR